MRESWRRVRRAPGYKVSSRGRVRNATTGQVLTPWLDAGGYLRVTLRGESVMLHHLVLEAFHGPRPYGMEGCHGPQGRAVNTAAELRWDTHAENIRDKRRNINHSGTSDTSLVSYDSGSG